MDEEKRKKIFDDLEKYCELDTLAMVEIFNHLVEVSKVRAEAHFAEI